MTPDYKHFSEDSRWVEIGYSKFMENSQNLSTRVITQLCNIIPLLEKVKIGPQFYLSEQYLISKIKVNTFDKKTMADKMVKYLNTLGSSKSIK